MEPLPENKGVREGTRGWGGERLEKGVGKDGDDGRRWQREVGCGGVGEA